MSMRIKYNKKNDRLHYKHRLNGFFLNLEFSLFERL